MKFELTDGVETLMIISAVDEDDAWDKLKIAGIKNKSKKLELVPYDFT